MPTVLVFLIDLLLAAAAVEGAGLLDRQLPGHAESTLGLEGTTVAAVVAAFTAALGAYLTGLHAPTLILQHKQVVARTGLVAVGTALATLVVAYFVWYQPIGRTGLLFIGLLTFALLTAWRLIYARFIANGPRVPMVVLGTGPVEQRFARRINGLEHTRYVVRGLLEGGELDPGEVGEGTLGIPVPEGVEVPPVLGGIGDAVELCQREAIHHAVVVGATGLSDTQVAALSALQAHGVRVHTAGTVWMTVALQVPIDLVDARWVLNTFEQLDRPGAMAAKRLLDLGVASVGLLLFALMFPVLWPLQRLLDPGPFFYSQDRVGFGGAVFRVHKIRTMRVAEREEQRWAATNDDRTTRLGRLLRRTRIDEFPQFWNVLRGEMSLVGPRPEQPKIVEQLEDEIPYFGYRHLVKPGITGWAQIHQGYAASVDESALKLSYDLYYVGRLSLLMDLDIMLRTAFVMAARIGSR
ncbi:putative glycosyltransferase [Plesiocystis pacifica SIR-1]|uniref:Putative glycosyltransferase n=1 Tax=Plesiocystis pacifica SIR-1 TaxID=391625 RepID=A6G1S2_9BACT|nr:exopolysaccharide biosynthesis polyprenyl glycosylphosphotransferase [Plesiocystis pacifica]EDM80112.1 putative glycosyltransferase [Plesiocystis pacifica SIR-1]